MVVVEEYQDRNKIMKTFSQFIFEAALGDNPINWTKPNADSEHDEILHQHKSHEDDKKNGGSGIFPDWVAERLGKLRDKKEWHRAMSGGKVTTMTRRDVAKSGNSYPSWRQVEPDAKKRRAPTLYGPGKKVERPIYLRNPETGKMHLISGAHRSAYVTDVMKRPIEAHVIE